MKLINIIDPRQSIVNCLPSTVKLLALTVLVTLLPGCGDFLEQDQEIGTSLENFYQNPDEVELAVTGLYGRLQSIHNGLFWQFGELRSDNTTLDAAAPGSPEIENLNFFTMATSNGIVLGYWIALYNGVFRCNTILERIEEVTYSDQSRRRQHIAQARFFRALYYFYLVRMWGDVPLVLETASGQGDIPDIAGIRRTPTLEIYNEVIVPDLLAAQEELPGAYGSGDLGRITQGAALTVLGHAFMNRIPANYDSAIWALETVTTLGYELLSDYKSIFDPLNKNNRESILEIQYSDEETRGERSNFNFQFLPVDSGSDLIAVGNAGGGRNIPTQDLINAYEDGDLREEASVGLYVRGNDTIPYINKYLFPNERPGAENINWPMYRYGGVLLLLAEALNEQSPLSDGALLFLNRVRNRAGLPVYRRGVDFTTERELRDLILRERRVELAFENHRWLDLLRTSTVIETMNAHIASQEANTTEMYGTAKRLLPIPAQEADRYNYRQNDEWN